MADAAAAIFGSTGLGVGSFVARRERVSERARTERVASSQIERYLCEIWREKVERYVGIQ